MATEGNLQAPTRHPLDWLNPDFYNEDSLNKELERVFDICHGCRRCVSLCGAFPTLFDLVDESETMEVDGVKKADVEGYNDVASVFRSTAEGETGHAHGHLEFMESVGDPATGLPIGGTSDNLKASIAGETHEYTDMYPGMARTAREEGFDEIADWFETLAKAEKSHAGRFQRALDTLD